MQKFSNGTSNWCASLQLKTLEIELTGSQKRPDNGASSVNGTHITTLANTADPEAVWPNFLWTTISGHVDATLCSTQPAYLHSLLITTLPHAVYALQIPTCCLLLAFALPLPPVVLVLQPPHSGTHSHLAFATLPLPIPFVAFSKLTASSRPSALPSDSPKCYRFGHCLTLRTLNIHLLTCLLIVLYCK